MRSSNYTKNVLFSKIGKDVFVQTEPTQENELSHNPNSLIAAVIGDFGKWQLWISIMMCLLKLPNAWYQLNIIFMAPPQEFWCVKPESFTDYSDQEWRKICAPHVEEHPCFIFDPDLLRIDREMDKSIIPLVPCNKFVYDTTIFNRTITSDWDLVCSKHWMVHVLVFLLCYICGALQGAGPVAFADFCYMANPALILTQCVMMWGILIGGIFFGVLADKYGRKIPLMYSILIQSVASYITSVMTYYWMFLLNWFILALASGGIGIISFVISMEVVSGKWRTTIPVIYQLPFGIGSAIMAGLAYWLRDWRKLEFGLATLSSLYILYWFWLPESPRWLIATGRTDEAFKVLKKAAKLNGRTFHAKTVRRLLRQMQERRNKEPGFIAFLKSGNMRMKTMLLSMNWFFTGLAFYAFSQYLGSIGQNIFMTVAWTGIISTVGGFTCIFIITKFGRKTTTGIYQLITALCFVFIIFIPRDEFANDWPRLLFAGIGFAGMAGTIPALYLYSGELFPTLGRNVGVSGVTTFARVGSMTAPLIVSLDSLLPDLPLMILAVTSIAQIFLLLPLPETRDIPLPDTLEEAEKI